MGGCHDQNIVEATQQAETAQLKSEAVLDAGARAKETEIAEMQSLAEKVMTLKVVHAGAEQGKVKVTTTAAREGQVLVHANLTFVKTQRSQKIARTGKKATELDVRTGKHHLQKQEGYYSEYYSNASNQGQPCTPTTTRPSLTGKTRKPQIGAIPKTTEQT